MTTTGNHLFDRKIQRKKCENKFTRPESMKRVIPNEDKPGTYTLSDGSPYRSICYQQPISCGRGGTNRTLPAVGFVKQKVPNADDHDATTRRPHDVAFSSPFFIVYHFRSALTFKL
jgi:hypothetical protein